MTQERPSGESRLPATPGDAAEKDARPLELRRPTQAMSLMLTALLVLALLYTLALSQTLVVPLMLAMFLGLGLNPLVASAARLHIPRFLSAMVVMLAVAGGSVGAVTLLAPPAVKWLQQAPSAIRHDLAPKIKPFTRKLDEANRATQSLVGSGTRHTATPRPARFDVWDVIAITPRVLAFALTVGLLVFFFLIFGDRMLLKLVEVSPSFASKRHVVTIVRSIQAEVSRYIFTATCINFTLGALTALILWGLKMPDPLLWGGLAALANFVPYVGAISMTLVLTVAGSMHFDHLLNALAPALSFAALTSVEGNLVTPMIMGRRMRLSPVAILIWLLLWAWIWGIAGALLAVPMLTTVKLIAEHIRGWEWFAHLVGR
ncbi:AI-2E family transporter [Oleiagrimonas sp. MCCC 1A03011]|jgi:predicted PurR-regulated permease PerM|uniref:AI-2E family transporter n=1 Tax=Oleiagrimonas sp. MCCC 1A03011 TaxID=1926883 RepID=UPI001F0C568D|nr:AI-2E family transporter [Oleiagrimonas sp. MCCC 1A03011]